MTKAKKVQPAPQPVALEPNVAAHEAEMPKAPAPTHQHEMGPVDNTSPMPTSLDESKADKSDPTQLTHVSDAAKADLEAVKAELAPRAREAEQGGHKAVFMPTGHLRIDF